jgi:hypothetical protein
MPGVDIFWPTLLVVRIGVIGTDSLEPFGFQFLDHLLGIQWLAPPVIGIKKAINSLPGSKLINLVRQFHSK